MFVEQKPGGGRCGGAAAGQRRGANSSARRFLGSAPSARIYWRGVAADSAVASQPVNASLNMTGTGPTVSLNLPSITSTFNRNGLKRFGSVGKAVAVTVCLLSDSVSVPSPSLFERRLCFS